MGGHRELYAAHAERPVFTPIEIACEKIMNAGGIPVPAHPGRRPGVEYINNETLLDLKKCGLMGMECYYPKHTPEFTDKCVDFCRNNDMQITCGGDAHGNFGAIVYPNDYGELFDVGSMDVRVDRRFLRRIMP